MTQEGIATTSEERTRLPPERYFDRRTGAVDALVLADQTPRRYQVLSRAVRDARGAQLITTDATSLKLSDLANPLTPTT